MELRSPDPFFDQLKADVQAGIEEADRGELIDEVDVRNRINEVIDRIE